MMEICIIPMTRKVSLRYGQSRLTERGIRGWSGSCRNIQIQPMKTMFMHIAAGIRKNRAADLKYMIMTGRLYRRFHFPIRIEYWTIFPLTKEFVFGYMTKYLEEECITEHAVVLLDREEMAKGQAEIVPVFETECN